MGWNSCNLCRMKLGMNTRRHR